MTHQVESKKTYFGVFAALMVLTALTVWVSTINLGDGSIVAAIAIAVTKGLLVILFFMHVRHSKPLTQVVIFAGFLWLVILLILTLGDYLTRGWLPAPRPW